MKVKPGRPRKYKAKAEVLVRMERESLKAVTDAAKRSGGNRNDFIADAAVQAASEATLSKPKGRGK